MHTLDWLIVGAYLTWLVWDGIRQNVGLRYSRARGEADKAFAAAAHTIKQRIRSQRVMATAAARCC